uniref:Uncharacterized protein n=1 Tax=Hordeum vulgare subsp. vulgare TaxID=112509 RepID=A0A8I7BH88_HORVV
MHLYFGKITNMKVQAVSILPFPFDSGAAALCAKFPFASVMYTFPLSDKHRKRDTNRSDLDTGLVDKSLY